MHIAQPYKFVNVLKLVPCHVEEISEAISCLKLNEEKTSDLPDKTKFMLMSSYAI